MQNQGSQPAFQWEAEPAAPTSGDWGACRYQCNVRAYKTENNPGIPPSNSFRTKQTRTWAAQWGPGACWQPQPQWTLSVLLSLSLKAVSPPTSDGALTTSHIPVKTSGTPIARPVGTGPLPGCLQGPTPRSPCS